jgi:CRISPR-associated protein Cas1
MIMRNGEPEKSIENELQLLRNKTSTAQNMFGSSGVFLKEEGRRKFWEAYSRRMDTEVTHPVFGYKMAYRRMLEVQARQLWRFVRGEAKSYTGFTTR